MYGRKIYYQFFSILALLITGISIGWLTGLSVSPVVATLIAGITGSAAAVVAALSGIDNKPETAIDSSKLRIKIDPIPLGVLTFGILVGSVFGVRARNYHWMGSDVSSEISKWSGQNIANKDILARLFEREYPYTPYTEAYSTTVNAEVNLWAGLGLAKEQVAQRLFERRYPSSATLPLDTSLTQANEQVGTFLFATGTEECNSLKAAAKMAKELSDEELLVKSLESSTNSGLRQLPLIVNDTQMLQEIVEKVLCNEE